MYRANSGNKQGICMEMMFSLVVYSLILANVVRCGSPGNSLVTCTACQAVQAKDFSCNVNCQVANESKGKYYGLLFYNLCKIQLQITSFPNETKTEILRI